MTIDKGKENLYNTNVAFKSYWDNCLKSSIGNYDAATPEKGKCCAQFIVSREKLLEKPKEFYITMYDWLINNTDGLGNGDVNNIFSGWWTSRYAEWTWRYIFSN